MKIHQITEAPIEDYQLIGDFNRGHSFRHATDRRLVSNPRYIERIKGMFARTDVDIRIFMVNSTEALVGYAAGRGKDEWPRREPFLEVGQVDMQWLQQNMPKGLAQIQQQGGFNPDGINILFTNNSGAERRPMTGWIIGHRMGHALLRPGPATQGINSNSPFMVLYNQLTRSIQKWLKLYGLGVPQYKNGYRNNANYDAALVRRFLGQIGTFRSARENNLRTAGEFIYECFAQYLITGRVQFNAAPQSVVTGYAWGRPQSAWARSPEHQENLGDELEELAATFMYEFEKALHSAIGKIYVM